MPNIPQNQEENQQDSLQRIDLWLNVLDEQTTALLSNIDIESMTSVQRSQAACRLLTLMFRLLKLRQDYAQSDDSEKDALILKLIMEGGNKSEGVPVDDDLEDPIDWKL